MERITWSRIMIILGLFGMLLGALNPLEGCIIILPCAGLAALGAWMGQTRRRKLLYFAFPLIAIGVGAMFLFTAIGGIGGTSGRSMWWLLVMAPYPIGWILGLIGSVLSLVETFGQRPAAA